MENTRLYIKTALHQALSDRFGENRVMNLPVKEGEIPLLILDLFPYRNPKSPVYILMTNGLSDYQMPVADKYKGREFNELYFCLPDYWEWEAVDNPKMNWIYDWMQRMCRHAVEKNTWFGHGHTVPVGHSLSDSMKETFFMFCDPILMETEFVPIESVDKKIHFLSIIPLFKDEFEYKQSKGTFKLLQKMNTYGITEKLDDFRQSIISGKWNLLRYFRRNG